MVYKKHLAVSIGLSIRYLNGMILYSLARCLFAWDKTNEAMQLERMEPTNTQTSTTCSPV